MGICQPTQSQQTLDSHESVPKSTKQGLEASEIHSKYNVRKTLGKGASCRVVEASAKENDKLRFAIKIMSKDKPVCATLYKKEVDVLSRLEHKNIVRFEGNSEDDYNFYIVTGLCAGGELFDRIVNPDFVITEKIAASLVRDMLLALKYCHEHDIVHRDLKPENFVFETTDAKANVVLIDFGCAMGVDDSAIYKDVVGTVYYLAPELASQNSRIPTTGKVLKAADVWSMGVIAYVMLTGRPPFHGKSNREIFTRIVQEPLRFPSDVKLSDGFKDFCKKMLTKNPHKRLSLEAACEHPWVVGKTAANYQLNRDVIRYLRQFNYQSKLKKAITRTLAANMSEEPEKEVKRHFVRLDKDGDGFLDVEELGILLRDMGYAPSQAVIEAGKMLESADLNKDGAVDFGEFKAVWHRKLLTQHEQYIHRVFGVFDDNGDGFIDATELQGVLNEDFKAILDMIAEVDENKDNKISFDEFKKAMQEDITGFDVNKLNIGAGPISGEDLCEADIASDEHEEEETQENQDDDDEKVQ